MSNNKLIDKYTYRVEWSGEDNAHVASCLEFPSLAAHGGTAGKALAEIEKVVAETVKWLTEAGEPIPEQLGLKRYKGNLTLRVPEEVHKKLAIQSAENGVSINQYILAKIA
jgi:predicted HicB family RNase H-like nuclease